MKTRQQDIVDGLFEKVKKAETSAELYTEIKSDIQKAVNYQKTANLPKNILHTQDVHGYTLLMRASCQANLEIVQELLNNKADVNFPNKFDETALLCATEKKDPKYSPIVDALLAAGADPNISTDEGIQPLHQVIINGDLETLNKFATESKAIAMGSTIRGQTPLMFAVMNGSIELVQRVIELIPHDKLESELQEKSAEEKTVFDLAQKSSIIFLLHSHVTNIPKGLLTKDNRISLLFAVKNDSIELVQEVIELIPNDKLESVLQEKNAEGKTVFDLADEPRMIALLLSHVTNIPDPAGLLAKLMHYNQTDSDVVTALKILFNKAPSPELKPEDKRVYELYKEKLSLLTKTYEEEVLGKLQQIIEPQLPRDLLSIVVQYDTPLERYEPRFFYNKSGGEKFPDMSGIDTAIKDLHECGSKKLSF